MTDSALVLFGFDRPDLLRERLSELESVIGLKLYIFVDGQTGADDDQDKRVQECQELAVTWSSDHAASIFLSKTNKGLRRSVLDGLDFVFARHSHCFVFEDDCSIAVTFLDLGEELLKRGLMQEFGAFCGHSFYSGCPPTLELRTSRRFSSWGWMASAQTWHGFRERFPKRSFNEERQLLSQLTAKDPIYWKLEYRRLKRRIDELDTWAIPFDLFLREQGLETLKCYPALVSYQGYGMASTHTKYGKNQPPRHSHRIKEPPGMCRITKTTSRNDSEESASKLIYMLQSLLPSGI